MQKMAGPFIAIPAEIIDLLADEGSASLTYYVLLLRKCFIEEVENTGTEWMGGIVCNSQREIRTLLGGSGHLQKAIFPRWEDHGILNRENGRFYLPKYYKKGDAYIQPLRMKDEIRLLKEASGKVMERQMEMEGTIKDLLALLSNKQPVKATPRTGDRYKTYRSPVRFVPVTGTALSLLRFKERKIPLSDANKAISIFYKGIGQDRISGSVRESANKIIRNLISDGFSPGEIGYAIDWTVEKDNVKEEIRSFGILTATISKAIAAMKAEEEKAEKLDQATRSEDEEKTERAREAEEREDLQKKKDELSEEDRDQLRESALAELKAKGVYKNDMITEILIVIQENAILRKGSQDTGEAE